MIAPMRIGVPTEIKTDEYRVAITPAGVRELVDRGHEVLIQAGAGVGSAIPVLAQPLTAIATTAKARSGRSERVRMARP